MSNEGICPRKMLRGQGMVTGRCFPYQMLAGLLGLLAFCGAAGVLCQRSQLDTPRLGPGVLAGAVPDGDRAGTKPSAGFVRAKQGVLKRDGDGFVAGILLVEM